MDSRFDRRLTLTLPRRITTTCLLLAVPALLLLLGCSPAIRKEVSPLTSWQYPAQGQPVFGIVRLAVKAADGKVEEVRFYLDAVDNEHLIGTADPGGNFLGAVDWFTQETDNGIHTVYAVADAHGTTSRSAITLNVTNKSRLESIPPATLKMTPQNDKGPPQLNPVFKNIWSDPVPVEGPINTAGAEDSPFITPDGKTFYFWFNGDEMKDPANQAKDPMTGIYRSKKMNGIWQEPQRLFLQYFDATGFDGDPTVAGDTLWFGSIRKGNYRDIDIWTAKMAEGRWVEWTNAGELLNKTYQVGELHVTADGNELYFGSPRNGGKGQSDIWVTRKINGQWLEPENVAAVNTAENEGQPFISEDGTELWFTRDIGGPAIFRSVKVEGTWQAPEMVVSRLAGEPTMDAAGNLYFVHHRFDTSLNRVTEADIYVCYRN